MAKMKPSLLDALFRAVQRADQIYWGNVGAEAPTLGQFTTLNAIAAEPELSQNRLTEKTGIDRSTMSEIIQRLGNAGLVERRRSNEDSRAFKLLITKKGERVLAEMIPALKKANQEILGLLRAQERDSFLRDLAEIASRRVLKSAAKD